ncbi:MAG: hypothetical protein J5543_06230 [Bacteroidales bacterium]|nr:hypothetical protein [Bacteroidales bacterium]
MANNRKFDLKAVIKKLWESRKTLFWWCGIAVVLGVIFALTNPKEYTVSTAIVPEQSSSAGLASIASMMGVSLGNVEGGNMDAMDPSMFPDIAESIPFLQAMMASKVHTLEDSTTVTLHDYLKTEYVPWTIKLMEALRKFKDTITGRKTPTFGDQSDEGEAPRYILLSEKEFNRLKGLARNIKCGQNMKTGIITISTTCQDPMVATMMADNAINCLQESLYDYKSAKAKAELADLNALEAERRMEYEKRQKDYAVFLNQNRSANNYAVTAEKDRLEAEMTLAYQALQQVTQQRYLAEQSLIEKKPSYALLAPPTFPLDANGSRKMVVIIWLFLGFVFGSLWILYGRKYWHWTKNFVNELRRKDA